MFSEYRLFYEYFLCRLLRSVSSWVGIEMVFPTNQLRWIKHSSIPKSYISIHVVSTAEKQTNEIRSVASTQSVGFYFAEKLEEIDDWWRRRIEDRIVHKGFLEPGVFSWVFYSLCAQSENVYGYNVFVNVSSWRTIRRFVFAPDVYTFVPYSVVRNRHGKKNCSYFKVR